MKLLTLVFTVSYFVAIQSAITKDKIESLPGWNDNLPTNQYSGYLTVQNGQKSLHYWFVESENSPSTDPVIAWFNGGPGCSSLDGFFYENGPFAVNLTDGTPVLVPRDTRWNKFANVLYLEAPAGVGFSFANSAAGLYTNDSVTASNNYEAVQKFFAGFSEFRTNEFYIAGESYAGVYIPTLAYQIYQRAGHFGEPSINLKGIMVGNGCTGTEVGTCSDIGSRYRSAFLHGKGLFSDKLYQRIQRDCVDWANPSYECKDALSRMHIDVGPLNIYDVYQPCINSGESAKRYARPLGKVEREVMQMAQEKIHQAQRNGAVGVPPGPGPVGCMDAIAAETYLNQESVRKAIHVESIEHIGKWIICANDLHYTMTEANEPRDIYPTLIQNYRVLIFNGDADSCVPYVDNESWTKNMNIDVKSSWRPWYVNDQVAGYVTSYEQDFTFLTVKGAGHMVPQFKPVQGYEMAYRFVHQQPF